MVEKEPKMAENGPKMAENSIKKGLKTAKFFEKSPYSLQIMRFFKKKYCKSVAIMGILKACSIVSAQFKDYPRLSICMIAPTRHFKTQTSSAQSLIFSNKYYLDMGSDFTIHSLYYQFYLKDKKVFTNRCLMINDGTLLFSSKEARGKQRLINGMAEILSEGIYIYAERLDTFTINGKISVIINMTNESFKQNKNKLLSSTFLERFLTVHYRIPDDEQDHTLLKKRISIKQLFDDQKIKKIKDYDANADLSAYAPRINELSKRWAILGYRNRMGMFDNIEVLLKAHAVLNGRSRLCEDDFIFLDMVEPFIIDQTAPNQHQILLNYQMGMGVKDNCVNLGKDFENYKSYVYKVIKLAKDRGVI